MIEFKILDDARQSFYFDEPIEDSDEYYDGHNHFYDRKKIEFLNELKRHSDIKKQAGYSKSRDCEFVSLVLVMHNSGDGEFTGISIVSTCLIDKNNKIQDSNNYTDYYGEVGCRINAIYHQLPDGKVLEYVLQRRYQDELTEIYNSITKLRTYYDLKNELPEKQDVKKSNKIKI